VYVSATETSGREFACLWFCSASILYGFLSVLCLEARALGPEVANYAGEGCQVGSGGHAVHAVGRTARRRVIEWLISRAKRCSLLECDTFAPDFLPHLPLEAAEAVGGEYMLICTVTHLSTALQAARLP
jgi:hypothetical protein